MTCSKALFGAIAMVVLFGVAQGSEATLNAVDPGPYLDAYGFFPAWYKDTNGTALELCLSPAVIAADAKRGLAGGPACTLLANPGIFDPMQPISFPTNFPDESFWFMGDATIDTGGVSLVYVSNLEAFFSSGVPAPQDQISFARIRVRADVPQPGTYILTHPYGVETFTVTPDQCDAGTCKRAINMTRDIGIGATGEFAGALYGDIGPFLVDASVPILGPIPGINPITGSTELFIGDPNTPRPVVGSPFGTNFVRLDGPNGISVETELFIVSGMLGAGNESYLMPLPESQTAFAPSSSSAPVLNLDPSLANPIGLGAVAAGGDTLDIRIGTIGFSGPADVYFAVFSPQALGTNDLLLFTGGTFVALSQTELAPWIADTSGPLDQDLFGALPISDLPPGAYTLYLAVAPAGSQLVTFYLWSAAFTVP